MTYKFKFEKIPLQSILGAALLGCVLFGIFSGRSPHPDQIRLIGASLGVSLLCLSRWVKKDQLEKDNLEKDKSSPPSQA